MLELRRRRLALMLAVALAALPATAARGEAELDLAGSIRSIGLLLDSRRLDLDLEDERSEAVQTLLRLTAEGRRGDRLSYEVHLVQTHTYRSGGFTGAGSGDLRYRAWDATWDWWQNDRQTATLFVDRLAARWSLPAADITVGRQAITFGKAYFWNPLDVFLPFDPNQFDRDYKPGVDALRVDLPQGSFSGITLVGAWGRELGADGSYVGGDRTVDASWYGSAVLGRFFTNLSGWDVSVQGGKIYGGYQLGGGAVGEIGPLQIRAEGAYLWALDTDPLPPPFTGQRLIEDHATFVLGGGHRFASSLNLEVEHFVNGAGDPDNLPLSLLRLQAGTTLHLSRHITGLLLGYELSPLLRGQLATLYSWSDSSFQLQPSLAWSLSDNADFLLGANLNQGERPAVGEGGVVPESEFGSFPDLLFVEVKLYF